MVKQFFKDNTITVSAVSAVILIVFLMNSMFYAEPSKIYHVRTITGSEAVISNETGYEFYPFARVNEWKRAMTVQASLVSTHNAGDDDAVSSGDSNAASAQLNPLNIMFLDQVDANAQATARFTMPTDPDTFLKMAHEYRTPDNLLRTALIPAFKETLHATGSLMSAEEYYAGGKTEFNVEFENQMQDGIYIVKREEQRVKTFSDNKSSANASKGSDQEDYGEDVKTEFVVNKMLDGTGLPLRKTQKFTSYGVTVVDARITEMKPNNKFVDRMQLKQKASADRAIAREQRIQEEEQRLLAIAKGEREVAERQAEAKVDQIAKTTAAETDKQLAVTKANKLKEQAAIEKDTAAIKLAQAKIDAQRVKTLADAEAYKKREIMKADDALAQKLLSEERIQKYWADAYAKRNVPQYVFGGGGDTPTGSDGDAQAFMKLMTMDAAKRLSYDRSMSK